ncbi:primosome assembly protein PriA [Ornithinimicrobium sp. Y1694]|uniref:primosomal protein N' family DNA-binding protein n=1 Tax=Ornithinimicrobium sp. Y1694 TaxID=3418590 RepID=UPI003CF0DB05
MALVAVDTPLAHLDRPFEYLVPEELAAQARPGVRVRVRFSGRDHDGFILGRAEAAEHTGRLALLRSVVSAEPVLTPQVLAAAKEVAAHYGGTLADVLRLAVPPRHARAEKGVPPAETGDEVGTAGPGAETGSRSSQSATGSGPSAWDSQVAGPAFLRRIEAGEAPAAAWCALPARPPELDWPTAITEAVAATRRSGRGAVVVVPDHRDVDRVVHAIELVLGADSCVRLTADQGPEARYRAFVQLLRGHVRVAVGTRSAAWAPVRDAGLFVCWDDGDDVLAEPRSPYPQTRHVLRTRSRIESAALLMGGFVRTVEVQAWVAEGVLAEMRVEPRALRAAAPRVVVAGEGHQEARDAAARSARVPSTAWRALRSGLVDGPVLVQVPRRGYVVSLACQDCRAPVRCLSCGGPVGLAGGDQAPACRWCGTTPPPSRECSACGSTRLRASTVGASRTAEELGRAFPGVTVRSSGGGQVLAAVGTDPALVVATPGAEPVAEGGYRAVVLLDGWQLLDRASLDAAIESLRRWTAASALAQHGAPVVLCGVPPHGSVPAVEAFVRWDPTGLAVRELADRSELGLPPVGRHASLRGAPAAVTQLLAELGAAGHLPLGDAAPAVRSSERDEARALVRQGTGLDLAKDLHDARARRSMRRSEDSLRVQVDPADLGG